MLSDLCVRRPVFATMLVMSLVVLGIVLVPRPRRRPLSQSRPGDGQRRAARCPAPAPTRCPRRWSSRWRRRSAASPASTRSRPASAEGRGQITVRFVLERDLNDASNDVREKVASAIRSMPAGAAAAGHHQGRSRRGSGDVADRVVRRDEPAHADRAHRQADRPGHPDRQRRRRSQPRRRPGPRNPHRRRHREAELVRPVDDARCATRWSPRTSRSRAARSSRGRGSCSCAPSAASTPPPTSTTSSSRRATARRSACPTSATPRTASSGRPPRSGSAGHPAVMLDVRRAMGENTVAVIEGVRAKLATIERSLPPAGQDHGDPRRLALHLRLDRLARGAPDLRRAVRHHRGDGLHPQPPGGADLGAGDPGVDHLVVHADEHHGVHAEQHDAARHHARGRHRHRRRDRRAREHLPVHRGEEAARRSRRRSRAPARSRWR